MKKHTVGGALLGGGVFALCSLMSEAQGALLLRYTFDEASSDTTKALDSGSAPQAHGTFTGTVTRTGDTPGGHSLGALELEPAISVEGLADRGVQLRLIAGKQIDGDARGIGTGWTG